MSSAIEQRLAGLRAGLNFASPGHRPAILAMIAEIEAAAAPPPVIEAAPIEAAPIAAPAPSAVPTVAAARTRKCDLSGCTARLPIHSANRYCGPPCRSEAHRQWHAAHPAGNRGRRLGGAAAIEGRAPASPLAALSRDPAVVIRPPRPAPVRRYRDSGQPTEFQDDLNAIADHGSPGRTIIGGRVY